MKTKFFQVAVRTSETDQGFERERKTGIAHAPDRLGVEILNYF